MRISKEPNASIMASMHHGIGISSDLAISSVGAMGGGNLVEYPEASNDGSRDSRHGAAEEEEKAS